MAGARDAAWRFAWAALAAATQACDPGIVVGSDNVAADDDGGSLDATVSNDATASSDAIARSDAIDSGDATASNDEDATGDAGAASDSSDSGDALAVTDAGDGGDSGGPDDAGSLCSLDAATDAAPLVVPWSTGFENGLADYGIACYMVGGGALVSVVSAPSPVHTGLHSAAFTVDSTQVMAEARCRRTGVYPGAAYYGAWYYVPQFEVNTGNWNLLHFRAASTPSDPTQGIWDVSLVNGADGGLEVALWDFLRTRLIATGYPGPGQDAGSGIPINQWFHLEVFFRRACDSTGEFTLYVNSQVVFSLKGLATTNGPWGEWHVGNLATALSPPMSTLYVDDITISTTGP